MSIAAFLAKHAKTLPRVPSIQYAPNRVRADASGVEGTAFDRTEDGWVLWVDDEGYSHISHPSYVRGVS